MARIMRINESGVYRTIVETTYNEDHGYYKAGQSVTEVFGPHSEKSVNRNYSQIKTYESRHRPYVKADVPHVTDAQFEVYYQGKTKYDYHHFASQKTIKQVLTPVLALNQNGSLSLALDWVNY